VANSYSPTSCKSAGKDVSPQSPQQTMTSSGLASCNLANITVSPRSPQQITTDWSPSLETHVQANGGAPNSQLVEVRHKTTGKARQARQQKTEYERNEWDKKSEKAWRTRQEKLEHESDAQDKRARLAREAKPEVKEDSMCQQEWMQSCVGPQQEDAKEEVHARRKFEKAKQMRNHQSYSWSSTSQRDAPQDQVVVAAGPYVANHREDMEMAAKKVQALYRGRKARQKVQQEKHKRERKEMRRRTKLSFKEEPQQKCEMQQQQQEEAELVAAATKIQSGFRDTRRRKLPENRRDERRSARSHKSNMESEGRLGVPATLAPPASPGPTLLSEHASEEQQRMEEQQRLSQHKLQTEGLQRRDPEERRRSRPKEETRRQRSTRTDSTESPILSSRSSSTPATPLRHEMRVEDGEPNLVPAHALRGLSTMDVTNLDGKPVEWEPVEYGSLPEDHTAANRIQAAFRRRRCPVSTTSKVIICMIGPPGAGKATHAPKLAKALSIPALSTGVMLRDEISGRTAVGRLVEADVHSGSLVNDDIVVNLLSHRIQDSDCDAGFLIYGFPRTITQARALDSILMSSGDGVSTLIQFSAPDNIVVDRVCGRWIHKASCRSYHPKFDPPRSYQVGAEPTAANMRDHSTGGALTQRVDDNAAALYKRLESYHTATGLVLAHYKQGGLTDVVKIDANQLPGDVWKVVADTFGVQDQFRTPPQPVPSPQRSLSPQRGHRHTVSGARITNLELKGGLNSVESLPGGFSKLPTKQAKYTFAGLFEEPKVDITTPVTRALVVTPAQVAEAEEAEHSGYQGMIRQLDDIQTKADAESHSVLQGCAHAPRRAGMRGCGLAASRLYEMFRPGWVPPEVKSEKGQKTKHKEKVAVVEDYIDNQEELHIMLPYRMSSIYKRIVGPPPLVTIEHEERIQSGYLMDIRASPQYATELRNFRVGFDPCQFQNLFNPGTTSHSHRGSPASYEDDELLDLEVFKGEPEPKKTRDRSSPRAEVLSATQFRNGEAATSSG